MHLVRRRLKWFVSNVSLRIRRIAPWRGIFDIVLLEFRLHFLIELGKLFEKCLLEQIGGSR